MMLTPLDEIARRLADRVEEVCRILLPLGRSYRGEWLAGDAYGAEGESLKVQLTGSHVGQWRDWAYEEDHGDLLDLWRTAKGLDAATAIKEAKAFLGIRDPELRRERKNYSKPSSNGEQPLDESGAAIKWLTTERKLTPEIIAAFKIAAWPEKRAIVFPCYNPAGELVNRSYRSLSRDGEKKSVWQDTGCAPCLFGWHALPSGVYRERRIIICEGHLDCMTWAQWGFPALSVPNGSGREWIDFEWDRLAGFKQIYLSLDMDNAGRKALPEITRRLGAHRCYHIELPKKDANDCLQAGYTASDARHWVEKAKPPHLEGIILGSDMRERLAIELAPRPPCFTLPFFQSLYQGQGYYPRPGEVSVWSGPTESGKSTFLNFFTTSLALQNHSVFIASMEMRPETLLARMYRATLASTGLSENDASLTSFLSECGPFVSFADVFGYIGEGQLIEMMFYAFHRYGATHHIIDSLMKVSKLEEDYVAQGEFLNELQRFAKQTMAHVHLVAHPRKKEGRHDKLDIKGSSQIPNNADNILIVTRNENKVAATDYDTKIEIVKQRDSGWHGSWQLRFDPARYTYAIYEQTQESKRQ
jgi:twinkle protein